MSFCLPEFTRYFDSVHLAAERIFKPLSITLNPTVLANAAIVNAGRTVAFVAREKNGIPISRNETGSQGFHRPRAALRPHGFMNVLIAMAYHISVPHLNQARKPHGPLPEIFTARF